LKFSLKGKIQLPCEKRNTPTPGKYDLNHVPIENSRYKKISFGIGNRSTSTNRNSIKISPGPGSYKLYSPFDKFDRLSKLGKRIFYIELLNSL